MTEFSSSDKLVSLHSSLSDIYADIETEILQKGQAVERFIQSHQDDQKNSVCFSFLQKLFSLFKSEFRTNLLLRQALVAQRELVIRDQKYNNNVQSFLLKFHQNFPNLCQSADSLEEINIFSKKLFHQLNKYKSHNVKKKTLQDLTQKKKLLQQKNNEIKREYISTQQEEEVQFAEKQQIFQNLRIEQEDLTDKLNSLINESSELEKIIQNSSDINGLQYKIKDVDKKAITIVSNMNTMSAQFRRKIQKRKIKIEKFQVDIKELKENRIEIEKELDSVQAKIDYLTNPLATPIVDEITSPHEIRFQVIELKKNYDLLQQQLNEEQSNIQQMELQIENLEKELAAKYEEIPKKKIKLEKLNSFYEKQQKIVQSFKEKQAQLSGINSQLKISNDTKRSLNFDKIKLNRKLDDIVAQWRQLAIDNNSLKKTEKFLQNQKTKALSEIEQSTLSNYDKEMFESVLDANRKLREELLLSLNTSPKDIADIVIKHCNSL